MDYDKGKLIFRADECGDVACATSRYLYYNETDIPPVGAMNIEEISKAASIRMLYEVSSIKPENYSLWRKAMIGLNNLGEEQNELPETVEEMQFLEVEDTSEIRSALAWAAINLTFDSKIVQDEAYEIMETPLEGTIVAALGGNFNSLASNHYANLIKSGDSARLWLEQLHARN